MQQTKVQIKKKKIRIMLQRALKMLPVDTVLSFMHNGNQIASAGPEKPESPEKCNACIKIPVSMNGTSPAKLIMSSAALSEQKAIIQYTPVIQFIAETMQETIETEAGSREIIAGSLEQLREMAILQRAAETLNTSFHLQDVVEALGAECRKAVKTAEAGIILGDEMFKGYLAPVSSFGKVEKFGLREIGSNTTIQKILQHRQAEILNNFTRHSAWNTVDAGKMNLMCVPMISQDMSVGILILARSADNHFSSPDLKKVVTISSVAATAMANAWHFEEYNKIQTALLKALIKALESRDPASAGHSQRVALYAIAFANVINDDTTYLPQVSFTDDQIRELYFAALLHDVGKIGVTENVLKKSWHISQEKLENLRMRMALWGMENKRPWKKDFNTLKRINKIKMLSDEDKSFISGIASRKINISNLQFDVILPDEQEAFLSKLGYFTTEEWSELKRHPEESYKILSTIPFPKHLNNLPTIVRQHHEKLNASGYPDGLKDRHILIQSRILAITDIYDALTSVDRPYRRSTSDKTALNILNKGTENGELDPVLVMLFNEKLKKILEVIRDKNFHSVLKNTVDMLH